LSANLIGANIQVDVSAMDDSCSSFPSVSGGNPVTLLKFLAQTTDSSHFRERIELGVAAVFGNDRGRW
jgi:hypothetical protein